MRVFISSPSDLAAERKIALQVLTRLGAEFKHHFTLTPVLWEHEPLLATEHFQEGLVSPAECDIVLCMLWSRVGSPLPEDRFTRADGSSGITGTEWEFQMAAEAFARNGKPEILFYRKMAPVQVSLDDADAVDRAQQQKRAVDAFFLQHFHNDDAAQTFKNAYWTFTDIADLEEQVYTHLGELLRKQISTGSGPDSDMPVVWHQGSPYLGLRAFELEHADIYFGRNRARSAAFEQFADQVSRGKGFMMLLGTSGSGKSSLVKAGVLPMLLTPGVIEGVAECRWCVFKPSDASGSLTGALLDALLESTCLPELAETEHTREALRERVQQSPHALEALVFAALNTAKRTTGYREDLSVRVAIIIDQFEELFSLPLADAEREAFVSLLNSLVSSGHTFVVGTMRSDFYVHCEALPELVELMRGNGQFHLPQPTGEEIAQMIEMPARAAGLHFEKDADGIGLDEVLRSKAQGEPAILPLLSFTLEQLFDAREGSALTHAAYAQMGGIEGAITRRAEAVFNALPEPCQLELPSVLRALVTIRADESERVAARRCEWSVAATNPERQALVEAFVEARLLTVSGDANDDASTVAVAHEALLRNWHRASEWIADNIEQLRARTRIATAARTWDGEGRPIGLLLPAGALLDQGLRLADTEQTLDGLERDFVHAAAHRVQRERDADLARVAAARRTRRQQWFAGTVLAGFVIAAASLLFEGRAAREELDRIAALRTQQSEVSRINSFARLSMSQTRAGDSLNGLHLGIEATRRARDFPLNGASEAHAALHAAVWAQPRSFSNSAPVTFVTDANGNVDALLFDGQPVRVFAAAEGHVQRLQEQRGDWLAANADTAVLSAGNTWSLWNWRTGQVMAQGAGVPTAPTRHALSKDGNTWARIEGEGPAAVLHVVGLANGAVKRDAQVPVPGHNNVVVAADGTAALTSDASGLLTAHRLHKHTITSTVLPAGPDSPVSDVQFLNDDALVTVHASGERVLWRTGGAALLTALPSTQTHRELQTWPAAGAPHFLIAGGGNHGIRIVDAKDGRIAGVLLHDEAVVKFVLTPTGLASIDTAGTLYVWEVMAGTGRRRPAPALNDVTTARQIQTTAVGTLLVLEADSASLLESVSGDIITTWPLASGLPNRLMHAGANVILREDSKTISIRSVTDGTVRMRLQLGHEVVPMAIQTSSNHFATLSFGRIVEHREAATGEILVSAVAAHDVLSLSYSRDGQHLIARGEGQVSTWALSALSRIPRFQHPSIITDADTDPESGTIAVVGGPWLTLHEQIGRATKRTQLDTDISAVAVAPGGQELAVGLANGEVVVISTGDGSQEIRRPATGSAVSHLRWQQIGDSEQYRLLLTDARERLQIVSADGDATPAVSHWSRVSAVLELEGDYLTAAGNHLSQWRVADASGEAHLQLGGVAAFPGLVEAISATPTEAAAQDDTYALAVVREPANSTRVHDRDNQRQLGQIPIGKDKIRQFAASPDGSRIAVLDREHRLRIWAVASSGSTLHIDVALEAELLGALPLKRDQVCQPEQGGLFVRENACVLRPHATRLAFSSDGQYLLVGRDHQAVLIYDAGLGARAFAALNDGETVGFTLDNQAVLTRRDDGTFKTIALGLGTEGTAAVVARMPLKPFESPVELRGGEGMHAPYRITKVATEANQNGKFLITRSDDTAGIWAEVDEVLDASAVEPRAAVRLQDGSVAVLEVLTGTLLARIPKFQARADGDISARQRNHLRARFSRDGAQLIVWHANGGAVWPLHGRNVSAVAERILAGRTN